MRKHFLVGAHLSIAGGHHKALEKGEELGCEVVQIFTKNNMQWMAPPLAEKEAVRFSKKLDESPIKTVFGHAGYLINLATTDPEKHQKSVESLQIELERSKQLKLPFLVMHPGSHLDAGEEAGLEKISRSLDEILGADSGSTKIALEITAGQGTNLGNRIEHLATLIKNSKYPERLAVCLDTCHIFAAGYDLRTEADIDSFISEFKNHLPWETVVCLHLNDSKGDLGSRLDRHELLGKGKIGWECFETIMQHPAFADIPLCIETPKGKDDKNDREMLAKLKSARKS